MNQETIFLGILLVVVLFSLGMSYMLYDKLKKLKKSRSIQFSKIMDGNGDHGMCYVTNPLSSNSNNKYYMEFKVIGEVKNKNNNASSIFNICVTNVSIIHLDHINDEITKRGIDLIYETKWISDSGIYWFTDNDAKKRDEILTELLKDSL